MAQGTWITRLVRPLVYVTAAAPLAWITVALVADRVDGDQVRFIQHVTGTTALVSLFLTLSVTPVRRLSGMNELIRIRRPLGLTAFWYASLHLLSYLVFDHALSLTDIVEDIAEHPWVLLGFGTFLLLLPLAVTSTLGWVRRLGGTRWRRLHRLVYPAAIGGVLHYLWLVKKDVSEPLYFAVVLAVILFTRVWVSRVSGLRGRPVRGTPLTGASKSSTFASRGEGIL